MRKIYASQGDVMMVDDQEPTVAEVHRKVGGPDDAVDVTSHTRFNLTYSVNPACRTMLLEVPMLRKWSPSCSGLRPLRFISCHVVAECLKAIRDMFHALVLLYRCINM